MNRTIDQVPANETLSLDEQSWLNSKDPKALLGHCVRSANDRKLRRFAIAMCNHCPPRGMFGPEQLQSAERFAEGKAGIEELCRSHSSLYASGGWLRLSVGPTLLSAVSRSPDYLANDILALLFEWFHSPPHRRSLFVPDGTSDEALERYQHLLADFVRDIFGNPFQPTVVDPRWLSSSVIDIARAMYAERAFERMPILGDALMDAGCDSEEVINHCQAQLPHVRGCWLVDRLLGFP